MASPVDPSETSERAVNELTGTAFVTGGGRGIGASIAGELALSGMEVIVSGRTVAELELVAGEIGGRAFPGDVTDPATVERWAFEAGDVDLLVCNAGVLGQRSPFAEATDWWRTFEVNVLGVYLCCRAFGTRMKERRGGRIVNISSGSAYLPASPAYPIDTSYGASKAAVHRLSELLAAELEPFGVAVFSVGPGHVLTSMTAHDPAEGPWTPPECAPTLVRALASGEFDQLTGRYLHAEQDAPARLRERIAAIIDDDLNSIRLRR